MKEWLKNKLLTRLEYVIPLFFALFVGFPLAIISDGGFTPAALGIVLGTFATIVVWMVPIAVIDINKIKVRNPKKVFIEPTQLKLGLLYALGIFIAASITLIIGGIIQLSNNEVLTDNDGLVGSMLMTFALLSILFAPLCVYSFNAHIRYKRIVEYNSPEWKRIHKR